MYKVTSLQYVLDCFQKKPVWWITEMSDYLWKDRSLIHRYVKVLVEQWKLKKQWSWPTTRYTLVEHIDLPLQQKKLVDLDISYEDTVILDTWFYKFAPTWEVLTWEEGFISRCEQRNLNPQQKYTQYIALAQYIQEQKNECGLLNVTAWFREHIVWWALDELYYADQYKWMEFGRWKIAELTFYAKDTQNRKLITKAIWLILRQLSCLIKTTDIDAIAFAPHSKKRDVQLLKELEKEIDRGEIPLIQLVKYAPHGIIVAQKSLKTRAQRIQNAKETILIASQWDLSQYNKVLLIDDFVWSWATLNETAKKLKKAGITHVIWFAFVGNANLSYDVINEI